MGYFKDISADRETGYRTFPVVFGWRANAVYGDVTALVAAGLTAWVIVLVGGNVSQCSRSRSPSALQADAQVAVHRTRDEHAVGKPIADGVRALVLYCLAIVLALRHGLGPVRRRLLRRVRTGAESCGPRRGQV